MLCSKLKGNVGAIGLLSKHALVFKNDRIKKIIKAINNIHLAQLPEPSIERMAITIHDI